MAPASPLGSAILFKTLAPPAAGLLRFWEEFGEYASADAGGFWRVAWEAERRATWGHGGRARLSEARWICVQVSRKQA